MTSDDDSSVRHVTTSEENSKATAKVTLYTYVFLVWFLSHQSGSQTVSDPFQGEAKDAEEPPLKVHTNTCASAGHF